MKVDVGRLIQPLSTSFLNLNVFRSDLNLLQNFMRVCWARILFGAETLRIHECTYVCEIHVMCDFHRQVYKRLSSKLDKLWAKDQRKSIFYRTYICFKFKPWTYDIHVHTVSHSQIQSLRLCELINLTRAENGKFLSVFRATEIFRSRFWQSSSYHFSQKLSFRSSYGLTIWDHLWKFQSLKLQFKILTSLIKAGLTVRW